jgi:hypothetical protein
MEASSSSRTSFNRWFIKTPTGIICILSIEEATSMVLARYTIPLVLSVNWVILLLSQIPEMWAPILAQLETT